MATIAELEDKAARAEARLVQAAEERKVLLAGTTAAGLFAAVGVRSKLRALAPWLDALAPLPAAVAALGRAAEDVRAAVLSCAADDAQRQQLAQAFAPLAPALVAVEQHVAAAAQADNTWRAIPEELRLKLAQE